MFSVFTQSLSTLLSSRKHKLAHSRTRSTLLQKASQSSSNLTITRTTQSTNHLTQSPTTMADEINFSATEAKFVCAILQFMRGQIDVRSQISILLFAPHHRARYKTNLSLDRLGSCCSAHWPQRRQKRKRHLVEPQEEKRNRRSRWCASQRT